jgi:hypothetical protein
MQSQNHAAAFTNNYVLDMYSKYMEMYQNRYAGIFFFVVTWQHISYWRKTVTFLGGIAVSRGLFTRQQYLQDKNTVYGNPEIIKQVQINTADNKQQILTGGGFSSNAGASNCAGF